MIGALARWALGQSTHAAMWLALAGFWLLCCVYLLQQALRFSGRQGRELWFRMNTFPPSLELSLKERQPERQSQDESLE